MPFKRGPLHETEKAIIRDGHANGELAEAIAKRINRSVTPVQKFIDLQIKPMPPASPEEQEKVEKIVIRQELRATKEWTVLEKELVDDELEFFEEKYIKLMSQLRDVLASEETQIFQAIKFEILMSRNMKERKKCREDITRLERMQEAFLRKFNGNPSLMADTDQAHALNLETQLNVSRNAEQNRTNEYARLQERHEKLMQSLKSTRDQRIKEIEKAGTDLLSVIKKLQRRDVQEREGRQMELLKLAGDKAHRDLGELTEYEDGSVDAPILSADTLGYADEEKDADA